MLNPNNQYDMFGVPISDSWEDEMDSASLGTPENKDENPSTTQTDNDQVQLSILAVYNMIGLKISIRSFKKRMKHLNNK